MANNRHTFIGPVGRLARVRCPSDLTTNLGRVTHVFETLGGRDVVQWQKLRPRSWQLRLGATTRPVDVAALADMIAGSKPPWEFVTEHMAATNLFTPAGTAFADGTISSRAVRSGGVTCVDGVDLALTLTPNPSTTSGWTYVGMHPSEDGLWRGPTVIPGKPITFAAYMSSLEASSRIRLAFFDATGELIVNHTETVTAPSEGFERVSYSTTVPQGAAWVNAMVSNVNRVGGISLSLTRTAPEYSSGQGVRRVYVDQLDTDLTLIRNTSVLHSASFVVREAR